ncbi:hypothetical protein DES53_112171 [Roseimicrobium gellanilyticum]|uniref:Uncharacterized protein n=1 Tax=Roseimicrobium gellanilyticum TaxID=748857 RepID=A0A366H9S2_9BACT|nr:hypothetical protein DES53_112171 [Roseimicrobium gellanilyticum]
MIHTSHKRMQMRHISTIQIHSRLTRIHRVHEGQGRLRIAFEHGHCGTDGSLR